MTAVQPQPPASGERRPFWRPTTILITVILAGIAALWIYAFVFTVRYFDDPTTPDRVEDEVWVADAEAICAAAKADLDALPTARQARSPQERALVLDEANDRLAAMVADLRAVRLVSNDEDVRIVGAWLADWEIHIADRRTHTERLRAGEDPRFIETAVAGSSMPLSLRIDEFAKRANDMRSCVTPRDIGG